MKHIKSTSLTILATIHVALILFIGAQLFKVNYHLIFYPDVNRQLLEKKLASEIKEMSLVDPDEISPYEMKLFLEKVNTQCLGCKIQEESFRKDIKTLNAILDGVRSHAIFQLLYLATALGILIFLSLRLFQTHFLIKPKIYTKPVLLLFPLFIIFIFLNYRSHSIVIEALRY